MQQQEEIFVPIKDFPNYYISNWGRVYSAKREKNKTTSILTPQPNSAGYLQVMLCKDSKVYNRLVHRLVAQAFIPNPDNLSEVNHLDEDKTNNTVYNLEWSSHKDNIRYSHCKPIIDLTTGIIYLGTADASRALNVHRTTVCSRLKDSKGRYKNHQFMFLTKAAEDSTNTIELFGKKFEIPEVFELDDYELYDD